MVVWTQHAARDLKNIFDYIAADSKRYARRVTENIVARTEILEKFPMIGRAVPEVQRPEIREIIVDAYRVVYRCSNERDAEILTIIHGRQRFPESQI